MAGIRRGGGRLMCGIAGIALKPGAQIDPAVLKHLAAALAHRGPDGNGAFIGKDAALVHTRLAIIDIAGGAQPMFSGPLALVANGEIYNFAELRAELPVGYATNSDCEPPLKLFSRYAADYARHLRGMYAIAIHDGAFHTITLSRDPFGIKPLYTCETALGVAFASQPSALLAAGLARHALREEKLGELLNLQFTTGAETIFHDVRRVAPGQTLTLRDGKIVAAVAPPAWQTEVAAPVNEDDALCKLDEVLENSVALHQRADVPYGMFLSGGIDSAAVLAMMARLNARPLAYTAGFDVAGVADERDAAAAAAAAAGARHERVEIRKHMVWAELPEIVAAMDDPVADYAIIPTWFLGQRARQDVKVILSGEGGDEMFAGYGRYRAAARMFPFAKQMRARGIFDGLNLLREPPAGWRDGIAAAEAAAKHGSKLTRARMSEIAEWLPHDLLLKLDRCLMAHGVEGRTPLVDKQVAQFAFSLPDRLLIRDGQGKYLLRLWLERNLPAARAFARKQGFDVPIAAWIAADGRRLGELAARQPIIARLAAPDRVKAIFARAEEKRAGFAAWVLLFLALWHRRHGLGLPAAGDVFASLEAL